ncbi:MAG: 3'(2'),5'-bisphosphate nucleotidase CysQ [Rhizobiales bacterium]|nr:3'(2'),5'-bisphosphate nucleotidase CysQ [Hyphomicrobiales bacterium]
MAREGAAALPALLAAAREAGELILRAFRPGAQAATTVRWKHGNSPVTEADEAADALLRARLTAAFPEAGWLSEETADDPARLDRRSVLVVDPIDGTRAFMTGDSRFAVCAALVVAGAPVAGVVHLPARAGTFSASLGAGARLNGAPARVAPATRLAGARLGGPKPMIEALARAGAEVVQQARIPSLAYRIVSVASGALDAALASRDSHDWDLAAADAILHEAGGSLTGLEGARPVYNRPDTRHAELVAAPLALRDALLDAARAALRARG